LQLADGSVRRVTGQVDRLAVAGETVIIADYKTNAVPPRDPAGITESYVEQLALYRAVLGPLYPSKTIDCVIIYTATQAAFTLAEDRLDKALHRLRSRSAAA
jgi:ATP-dependent helicase/nuclease subunit A